MAQIIILCKPLYVINRKFSFHVLILSFPRKGLLSVEDIDVRIKTNPDTNFGYVWHGAFLELFWSMSGENELFDF